MTDQSTTTWRAFRCAAWPKFWGIERIAATSDEEPIVPPCMAEHNAKAIAEAHNASVPYNR